MLYHDVSNPLDIFNFIEADFVVGLIFTFQGQTVKHRENNWRKTLSQGVIWTILGDTAVCIFVSPGHVVRNPKTFYNVS